MTTDGVVERSRKLPRLTNGVGATGAEVSGQCVAFSPGPNPDVAREPQRWLRIRPQADAAIGQAAVRRCSTLPAVR